MEIFKFGSTGPLVELLQSILIKLGFLKGNLDGNFGQLTRNAVIGFQKSVNLISDGIVGKLTWTALLPYINGKSDYKIKSNDNLYNIAKKYNSTVNRIIFANPGINPNRLQIGQTISVPFGNIVHTNISYSSSILKLDINALKDVFPFIQIGNIGKSILDKNIPFLRLGTGEKEIFYSAAIHANEWITTPVLMKFIEAISLAYVNNTSIFGYNARDILKNTSIYIVPMCNPDGVDLVTGEIKKNSSTYNQAETISKNYSFISFTSGWKANIRGVDLNLQFPAGWENARQIKFSQGFVTPAPRDFVGFGPLTEPESLAIYNFTLIHNFSLILTYHTQGKEIYWQFQNYAPKEAEIIGNTFADVSGYRLADVPFISSFAGYKDWFLQEYRMPGYTIEAGLGNNPLPISQFNKIYSENLGILILGAILS